MFSLVTALVSPHVIDVLQTRKETLVNTLADNANVLCVQPSSHVCLLQGEWENVKKAYAILEELYFRVQAERAVGDKFKGNESQGPSATHRFWPPFDNVNGEPGRSRFPGSGDESSDRPKKHHVYVYPQSAVSHRSGSPDEKTQASPVHSPLSHGAEEDLPPQINRVDSYNSTEIEERNYNGREPYPDTVSVSSENNEPAGRESLRSPGTPPHLEPVRHTASISQLEVISDDDNSQHEEARGSPPDTYMRNSVAATQAYLESQRQQGIGQVPLDVSSGMTSSDFSKLTQSYLSTLSSLQQLSPQSKDGHSRLPPASYLLQSGGNGPGFFNYGSLYNQHLSALQKMPVKQEPGSVTPPAVDLHVKPSHQDSMIKSESLYDQRDANLPEFKCSHCEKTYRSEARMKEHLKTHDKNYVPVFHSCPKCAKSFTYRHNMIVHLRRFHFGWQPAKRHICRLCGMRFQKPYMLRDHEQRAHLKAPQETPTYNCTQCEAVFDNKHALAGHCSKSHNVCVDEGKYNGQDALMEQRRYGMQEMPTDLSADG